jgi:undecaprenyl-diphosphatase
MRFTKTGFALLVGSLIVLTYCALTDDRFGWDLTITRWVQTMDTETLGPIVSPLYWMRLQGVAGALLAVAAGWLWFKGKRAEAFFLCLVVVGAIINVYLRHVIDRPRPTPDLVNVISEIEGNGFPSGHALQIILTFGFLLYLSGFMMKAGPLRCVLWAFLGISIPIVGVWLVYCGRHWPSDVIAGYLYGALYLWLLIWSYRKYVGWRRQHPTNHISREALPAIVQPFAWILKMIY